MFTKKASSEHILEHPGSKGTKIRFLRNKRGAHIAIIMPSRRPERPTRIEIMRQAVIDDEPLDEGLPYMREHTTGQILRSLRDQIPRLTQAERETLSIVGLWSMILMPAIRFHLAMLMALMERWDPDTCTFQLPVGEMTVTLEDVYRMLRLQIRGATVTYATDRLAEDH
ncbi:hypothetical protein SUGI_0565110 [Cryptomeria japonica]|nr:hypothetical protein SUGI_0565110 [Cryptomeria japonica]